MYSRRFKNFVVANIVLLLLPFVATAEVADDLVAKVGNISISRYELNREMQRLLPMSAGMHGGVSQEKVAKIRQQALDELIAQARKFQYAVTQEISLPNSAVDERLKAVYEKFKTDAELEKALGGEAVSAFRSSIYRMLLAEKAEQETVVKVTEASESEIEEYYNSRKEMYKRPKRYRVSHILVKVDPRLLEEERVKLLVKAEDLYERALAGEDFYNLAYYNSDEDTKYVGGDVGYFHSGQVVPEFEAAIKDLKPGDIVGPVETLSGFHIVKLTEVEEPKQMLLAEVKDKIEKRLEEKRRDALYEEWMSKLAEQYPAEIFVQ